MSRFQQTIIFLFLLPGFVGCATHTSPHTISDVAVAEYQDSDEHVAEPLTVEALHRHGIMAGGGGLSGWMYIEVPPSQVEQAHRILQSELADLSQKQRDSFQILWDWERGGAGSLDSLWDIPQLKEFKANTSETKFLAILQRQKTDFIKRAWFGGTTYEVKPTNRVTVYITFKNRRCSRVARINGLNPI